jgi:hypothetical protein
MARRSNPWFSFESDNDDIDLDQDVLGTDTELDETAVDDAGDDSETVNVTPDKSETAHNELASAGGVVVGNNADQLEMDPVAASESFIRRFLGLSREDMEEAVDEITEKAETIPDADEVSATGDPELDDALISDGSGTTVNITSPHETHIDINAAEEDVEVGTDAEIDSEPMTSSDVAAVEGFRRLWSMEDDMEGGEGGSDVELDVKTSDADYNFELEGKAVTIEPNEDGGDDDYGGDYGDDEGSGDEGGDYGSDEGSGDEGGDYGSEEGGEGEEEETKEGFYFW